MGANTACYCHDGKPGTCLVCAPFCDICNYPVSPRDGCGIKKELRNTSSDGSTTVQMQQVILVAHAGCVISNMRKNPQYGNQGWQFFKVRPTSEAPGN